MPLTIHADPVPLYIDSTGTVRVAGTRVTLETLVEHFRAGASVEEMAERFPVLTSADLHAVLAYYLHHREEVDSYIANQEEEANRILQELATYHRPWSSVQEQLLSVP